MPTLGSYQLEQRLAARGPVSLYAAQARDGGAVRLRVFEPAPLFAGEGVTALWAARLLESGRLQQEVAGADGSRWARVIECGRSRGVAYVATEAADATLGDLVEGGWPLDARALRPIAAGIVAGLGQYHRMHGRAMGSLGFDTVLIGRVAGGELKVGADGSGVLLTDPSPMARPRPRSASRADPSNDVADLGRLLWRVVEGKDEQTPVPPTASPGPAWKRLGRSGEAWRELVNTLIDPRAHERGALPDLVSIADALPVEPFDWRKPVAITGGVAAAVAIGVAVWQFTPETTPEQRDVAADQLVQLVIEHAEWLGGVKANLAPRIAPTAAGTGAAPPGDGASDEEAAEGESPEAGAPWRDAPGLAAYAVHDTEAAEAFDTASSDLRARLLEPMASIEQPASASRPQSVFDPARYAQPWEGTMFDLALVLQEKRGLALLPGPASQPATLRRIESASLLAGQLRVDLKQWVGPAIAERWASTYEDRGWTGLSRDLSARAERWRTALAPTWEAMEPLLEAAAAVEQIEALGESAERLEEVAERRPGIGLENKLQVWDRPLERAESASEALASAVAERREMASLIELAEDAEGRIDWEALAASEDAGAVRRAAQRNDFRLWIAEVNKYARLSEDPRPDAAWDAALAEMRDRVRIVQDKRAEDVARRMEEDIAEAAGSIERARALPAVAASEARLLELIEEANEVVARADQRTEDAVEPFLQTPEEFIAERRRIAFDSPGLDDLWRAWLGDRTFEGPRDPAYNVFFNQTNELLGQFQRLDDEGAFCRVTPAPGGAGLGGDAGGAFDAGVYLEAVRAERERRVADLGAEFVGSMTGSEGMSGLAFSEARQAVDEAFDAWQAGALEIAREAVWLRDRLVEGYRLTEPVGGDASRTIEAVLASIDAGDPSYGGVRRAASGVRGLIGGVRAVRDAGSVEAARAALSAGGRNAGLNARLAQAWAWASSPPENAGGAVDLLDFAAEVRLGLLGLADAGDAAGGVGAARGATLRSVVTLRSPEIWRASASAAEAPGVFGEVVRRRSDFGVAVESLAGALWWRTRAAVLVGEEIRELADAQAQPRVFEFWREVNGRSDLPGWVRGTPLFVAADQLARDEEPEADPTALGPALAGWSFDAGASVVPGAGRPPEKLVYTFDPPGRGSREMRLTFRLVTGSGEVPVLMTEEEVSVGVALWAIGNALGRNERDVVESMESANDHVRTWTRSGRRGGRLSVADEWLPEQGLDRDREPLAPELRGSVTQGPGRSSPMQTVGPHVAMAIARGMGCRLPTVSEFRSALRTEYPMYEPGNGQRLHAAMDQGSLGSNLRRSLWRAQFEYAQGAIGDPAAAAVQGAEGRDWGGSDGALWFRDVDDAPSRGGANGRFRHLLGNVAEWVVADGAGEKYEVNPEDPQTVSLDALWQSLRDEVGVMGHSALSPAADAGDVDRALGPAGGDRETMRAAEMRLGYSDVGFRLAISPKGRWGTIEDWLADRLDESLRLAQR